MMLAVAKPEVRATFQRALEEQPMGQVHVSVRIENPFDQSRFWEGQCLVDTGATTSVFPTSLLENIGIQPRGVREYQLVDGSTFRRMIGSANFTVFGQDEYATVVFGEENLEPILGLTVLEGIGLIVDPKYERLLERSALAD